MVKHCSTELSFNYFFFSSRRRHTRCLSDWSSDVCSSDLRRILLHPPPANRRPPHLHANRVCSVGGLSNLLSDRSEERRVGKECRCRYSPAHQKKKKEETIVDQITTTYKNSDIVEQKY